MHIGNKIKNKFRLFLFQLPHNILFNLYKHINRSGFKKLQEYRNKKIEDNSGSYKQFDQCKCIFIHIPKTAGVSINRALFGNLGAGHTKLVHYSLVYNKKEFNSYFKFAFVRNPWDRLVSAYFFLKEGGFVPDDKKFYNSELSQFENFKEFVLNWVNKKNIYKWIHFVPQYEFVSIKNRISVDKIYKVEDIDAAIVDISQKLNKTIELKKNNKTKNREKDYRTYYDSNTKQIVADIYKKDIQLFNYQF